jgi:lipopolysaccharide export system protein LptC
MSNFVTTQTDINGALRYKLAATEMKHFPDDDTTELQRPRYTQFAIDKPYTQVEGLHGYMSSNGEKVELFDNVKVTRQAFAGKGEMTVETSYLSILPNTEIVSTDRPVVIRQAPKTVIHATGMLYEKKKNTVSLLHKVRAHYERPNVGVPAIKSSLVQSKYNKATKALVGKGQSREKQSRLQRSKSKKSNLQPPKPQQSTSHARIRRRYD